MKIIVTGVKGQLGYDVVRELKSRHYNDVVDIDDLDITNKKAVELFFASNNPDAIIHCAAYTDVDKAEDNKELCFGVNIYGTKNLVQQAIKYNSKFIYISTDYVFDGKKDSAYEVSDETNPLSIYGLSKLLGEIETRNVKKPFIIRTSWVFGKNSNNFVKTMLSLGNEKEEINVISDQIGSPTYTYDLSRLLVDMIGSDQYGTYHATNEGECSWYEFTKEMFKIANIKSKVNPIHSFEYPTRAKRPMNSRMSKRALDTHKFNRLPSWKDALQRYLNEIEVI